MKFTISFAILLLTLSSTCFLAAAKTEDDPIDWNFGLYDSLPENPIHIKGGDVSFVFGSGPTHNVYEFRSKKAYQDCDFEGSTEVIGDKPGAGGQTFTVSPSNGKHYYGCKIGRHCLNGGMKIAVVVSARRNNLRN